VDLWLHLENLTVNDVVAVELNGTSLVCVNPMRPGGFDPSSDAWLRFDLMEQLPIVGDNEIRVHLVTRNARLADEFVVEIADVELEVRYDYPDGEWRRSPGWYPRT
jgi:hypothetical protein